MNVYLENAKKIQKELVQNRRILHKNPEVNSDLKNTRKFVQKKLDEYGILSEVCQSGGIKACIGKNQGGKVFLLRADMDALPVQEKSGEDFSSLNGKMHACGHDLHTAMLLGAAKLLKEQEDQLKGTVKIMFQEDEEGMTGARNMVETGILLNPPVDAAMALHVIPGDMKVGVYCCNNGFTSSAIDVFRITVRGKGAHGATPNKGVDPISISMQIYQALQSFQTREIDAHEAVVISVGSFHAGNAVNVIPDYAVLEGTIRTLNSRTSEYIKKRMEEISECTGKAFKAECTVEFLVDMPACFNDQNVSKLINQYAVELGFEYEDQKPQMVSEDFAVIASKVPSGYVWIGAGGDEPIYRGGVLHDPTTRFNEEVLPWGAALLAYSASRWLEDNM